MKIRIQTLIAIAGAAGILCGCGKSNSTSSTEEPSTPPAAPTTEQTPAANATQPAAETPEAATPTAQAAPAAEAVKTTAESAQVTVSDLASQLSTAAQAQTDKTL
ncbi:MAG TPA: hypothetical protein VKA67_01545, partial [Verrucomicrobiae bacterium]|nr:hypothetical protein [Verrucomicrobiae bacterium]